MFCYGIELHSEIVSDILVMQQIGNHTQLVKLKFPQVFIIFLIIHFVTPPMDNL